MAEPSNISVAVVAEKRSHVIKIDRYLRAKSLLKNGEYVKSNPFSVAGHQWVVSYYPNGLPTSGCISVYLDIDHADAHLPKMSLDSDSGHLIDDCFSIGCDITVLKDTVNRGDQFVVVPPSNLYQHLGDLLSSTDGADVTFHVGGETFSAHRSVLAARSSVFKAELLGAMKENSGDPIKIDDMEACVFKSLLNFIYTDSLPWMTHVTASHLLVAADRYNIERLKLICEEKLSSNIDSAMVATSLALAEQHSCRGLKEACLRDGYEHLKSSCPAVLRELIVRLLPVELEVAKDIVMAI
ncbi:hypothetical protein BRADI_4g23716v3 [Brachypodium distachyon]|uniref:BTB domain-containing protein n=1 Tax=Brachypodium distachyon TaxID=15368 RepID=A0A2K2CPU7_BRADI|nr:hypothetical protein BRADI_4g23716v3 [Brachypodium distachyon]